MNQYKLTKDDLITLLSAYLQQLPPRWQSLQSYISIYVTLVSGILAVTIAGVKDFKDFPLNLFLLAGPALMSILSYYAKVTIKRQNSHIKELIVFIAKLEYQLGLYDTSQERTDLMIDKPWTEDKSFLPPKWIEVRLKSGKDSTKFIEEFQSSSALVYHKVFTIFQIFAGLIALLIIMLPFI